MVKKTVDMKERYTYSPATIIASSYQSPVSSCNFPLIDQHETIRMN
jgi:hypothetical protein